MQHGGPKIRFEKRSRHARSESLDCLTYGYAARSMLRLSMDQAEDRLRHPTVGGAPPADEPIDEAVAAMREKTKNWWRPRQREGEWF